MVSGDVAISNTTVNAMIRYGNSVHKGHGCSTLHSKLRPNCCRQRYGYFWQLRPILVIAVSNGTIASPTLCDVRLYPVYTIEQTSSWIVQLTYSSSSSQLDRVNGVLATIPHDWHSRAWNNPPTLSKVDDFHVIWKGLCDFLLVINSNLGPISRRFWNTALLIRDHRLRNTLFLPHLCSAPNLKMFFLRWIAEILLAESCHIHQAN